MFLLGLQQFVGWQEGQLDSAFPVGEGSEVASLPSDTIASDPNKREVLPIETGLLTQCDAAFGVSESQQSVTGRPQLWVSDVSCLTRSVEMVDLTRHGARMRVVVTVGAPTLEIGASF